MFKDLRMLPSLQSFVRTIRYFVKHGHHLFFERALEHCGLSADRIRGMSKKDKDAAISDFTSRIRQSTAESKIAFAIRSHIEFSGLRKKISAQGLEEQKRLLVFAASVGELDFVRWGAKYNPESISFDLILESIKTPELFFELQDLCKSNGLKFSKKDNHTIRKMAQEAGLQIDKIHTHQL